MLTEGWDANTVTHVLGVRAFGTQLLCETGGWPRLAPAVLRARTSTGCSMSNTPTSWAFRSDFTAKPVVVNPVAPKLVTRVQAVKERVAINPALLRSMFPRVEGYRVDLPDERITASFKRRQPTGYRPLDDRTLPRAPWEGIVGQGVELTAQGVVGPTPKRRRLSSVGAPAQTLRCRRWRPASPSVRPGSPRCEGMVGRRLSCASRACR